MKSSTLYKTLIAFAVIILAASAGNAQAEESASIDASGDVDVNVTAPTNVPPRPNIKAKPPIKAENRLELNRGVRNAELIKEKETRADDREERKEERAENKQDTRILRASTTMMFKQEKNEKREIAKKMQIRTFEIRKNALVQTLKVSLRNLDSVSVRLEGRITKAESDGKTLTDAKTLLVTAKDKLVKAKAAVAAFESYKIASSTASVTASTTAEIELAKPRVLGDAAIKSVKEARDAFKKVTVAIAQSLGNGRTATSTPVTASTTISN